MQQNRNKSIHIPFITRVIATGFFSGYLPWASGTFGTLVGILFYLIPGVEQPFVLGCMIILGFFVGTYASAKVAQAVGHRLTTSAAFAKEKFQPDNHNVPDPSIVVIDEIVGVWIALFLLPETVVAIVLGFIAFRVFDIVKPFPIARLERIPNGWGIMLDDVAAGVYANVLVRLILLFVSASA